MTYLFGRHYRAVGGVPFYLADGCWTRAWPWRIKGFWLRLKLRVLNQAEWFDWEKSNMAEFKQLAIATKRARNHGVKYSGPFTPVGCTGPLIAARNYCLLLDSYPDSDYLGYLVVMNMWAESLNQYCDNNFIVRDEALTHALGAFLSRQIVDATKLNGPH